MEQNQLDKGLRKAMKASASPRLSTNFTFRTMLKVQEAEQKQEKQMFWATVAASVFLLVGGGVVIGYFWDDVFLAMFTNAFTAFARLDLLSSPYVFLSLAVLLLLGFDYWMRRAYFKRHSKE